MDSAGTGSAAAPVRVLHIAMNGSRHGGAEIQYELLFAGLDPGRFVPVISCPTAGDLVESLSRSGHRVTVDPLPLFIGRSRILRRAAPRSLLGFARRERIGLVHCEFERGPFAHDVGRALGVPVILHVRRALAPDWYTHFELQRADRLVAIGERFLDALLEHGAPPGRVAIIPDSTDVARFRPEPGAPDALGGGAPSGDPRARGEDVRIGLVGRFEAVKRQREAVEALSPLLARRPRFRLFLIGDPEATDVRYAESVRASVPPECARQVVETGRRDDMPEVLRSLDLLLTLSGGSVMLEALASGVPVVTMSDRDPAALRIVRHRENGWVVGEGDFAGLVDAVERLGDDAALRSALGRAGREHVCAEFGVREMALRTQALYREVLDSGRADARKPRI